MMEYNIAYQDIADYCWELWDRSGLRKRWLEVHYMGQTLPPNVATIYVSKWIWKRSGRIPRPEQFKFVLDSSLKGVTLCIKK